MENRTIVFATSNPHKVKELNEIMAHAGVTFVLPDNNFNPIEDGKTFLENSKCKALAASDCETRGYNYFLADDSGLCVDYLKGEPGIKSARYEKTPELRIKKLLKNMEKADNRTAHFTCALTLCDKNGKIIYQTEGHCYGSIAKTQSGKNGFGYDPVFLPDGYEGKTLADLDEDIKNKISHRANALNDFAKNLPF